MASYTTTTSGEAIKFANLAATSDGDNTVVAAVTGKRIVVLGYAFTVTAQGTVTFKDSSSTFGSHEVAQYGGVAYAGGLDAPAFATAAGAALVVNVDTNVDALGHITYIEV